MTPFTPRQTDQDRGVPASPSEGWRPCHGYEGFYEVSNLGRIRTAATGHILSTAGTDKDGYPVVSLNRFKVRKTHALHRLVALSFHGEKCNVLHNEVAHLDGDRTNVRADNLKWVSKVENHFHMRAHGTHPSGEKHPKARLTVADVRGIREAPEPFNSAEAARKLGVHRDTVRQARRGITWRTI